MTRQAYTQHRGRHHDAVWNGAQRFHGFTVAVGVKKTTEDVLHWPHEIDACAMEERGISVHLGRGIGLYECCNRRVGTHTSVEGNIPDAKSNTRNRRY